MLFILKIITKMNNWKVHENIIVLSSIVYDIIKLFLNNYNILGLDKIISLNFYVRIIEFYYSNENDYFYNWDKIYTKMDCKCENYIFDYIYILLLFI
jgi:hypothetical protein